MLVTPNLPNKNYKKKRCPQYSHQNDLQYRRLPSKTRRFKKKILECVESCEAYTKNSFRFFGNVRFNKILIFCFDGLEFFFPKIYKCFLIKMF